MTTLRSLSYVFTVLGSLAFIADTSAQKADLVPAAARAEVVAKANELIARDIESAARLPDEPTNPFTGKIPTAPTVGAPVQVIVKSELSDDQKLKAIAPGIQPTGTIALGGESYLLFGQKKLKVGDSLPIVFQGATYDILVTGIQSTSFSIRLGGADLVRPIKPTRP